MKYLSFTIVLLMLSLVSTSTPYLNKAVQRHCECLNASFEYLHTKTLLKANDEYHKYKPVFPSKDTLYLILGILSLHLFSTFRMIFTILLPFLGPLLCYALPQPQPQDVTPSTNTTSTSTLTALALDKRLKCDSPFRIGDKPKVVDCFKLLPSLSSSSVEIEFRQQSDRALYQGRSEKCVITAKIVNDEGILIGGNYRTSWLAIQLMITQLLTACAADDRVKGELKSGEWGQFVVAVGKGGTLVGDEDDAAALGSGGNTTMASLATASIQPF